eukprot:2486150-Prorocentrum_lima.AAC.1
MDQKGRVHGARGDLNNIKKVMLHNVQHPSPRHGISHRRNGNRSPSGTYPTEVIKKNYAPRGRAS